MSEQVEPILKLFIAINNIESFPELVNIKERIVNSIMTNIDIERKIVFTDLSNK